MYIYIITFVMWSTERWNWLHRWEVRLVTNYHEPEIIRSLALVIHSMRLYLCCGRIHSPCPILTQWGTKKTCVCNETYCNLVQTLCWLLLRPLCHFVTLELLSGFGDPLEMSLWTFRPDDWVFRTPLWYGVLISNCFALSPIKRLSLLTGDTATTNFLTFFNV